MKILYSCLSKSWGGMEMFTLTAIKQLLKKNCTVELLCIEDSRLHLEARTIGIIIHPVKVAGYFHPFSILRIANIIRKNHYDLIHTQASKDLWFIVPTLKLLKKNTPLILTKQVGSFIVKKDMFHKFIYKRLNLALAISQIIKKNLLDTCPLTEDKILLLHNGIDTKIFDPAIVEQNKVRDEFGIQQNEILIGMLARLSPGKGHEEFLLAAKRLKEKFDNLKFIIVGEASRGEDDYANQIKKLAQKLKLNNLIFTGFRKDTPEVLAAMDIFVFPSHNEAFGISLAEAMAMGKPSVCSNTDGVLDIAVDEVTSLLFETKNAYELQLKIEKLINSNELRKKLGEAARKHAVENFDLEILTDKVINIYKNTIANNTGIRQ